MDEASKEYTAFTTYDGLYQFNVLPFGLCNAPSTFQYLMEHVLRGLNWKICLIYINDIILFSRSFEDHMAHLHLVFTCLRDANIKLKAPKCHFAFSKINYLGHMVSRDGIDLIPKWRSEHESEAKGARFCKIIIDYTRREMFFSNFSLKFLAKRIFLSDANNSQPLKMTSVAKFDYNRPCFRALHPFRSSSTAVLCSRQFLQSVFRARKSDKVDILVL